MSEIWVPSHSSFFNFMFGVYMFFMFASIVAMDISTSTPLLIGGISFFLFSLFMIMASVDHYYPFHCAGLIEEIPDYKERFPVYYICEAKYF